MWSQWKRFFIDRFQEPRFLFRYVLLKLLLVVLLLICFSGADQRVVYMAF